MNELNGPNEFEVLSPRERAILLQITVLEGFPKKNPYYGDPDKIDWEELNSRTEEEWREIYNLNYQKEQSEIDRRKRSQHKAMVFKRINGLFAVSPATHSFKELALNILDRRYSLGIYRELIEGKREVTSLIDRTTGEFLYEKEHPMSYEIITLRTILGLHRSESLGIFDPNSAEEIEKMLFGQIKQENRRHRLYLLTRSGIIGIIDFALDAVFKAKTREDEIMKKWPQEYRQHYGRRLKPLT